MLPLILSVAGGYLIGNAVTKKYNDGGIIKSARITDMPKDLFDEMPKVYITYEDGKEEYLFDYYPDEISFTPEEFVGLTKDQAKHLKYLKDRDYLMYSNQKAFDDGGSLDYLSEEEYQKFTDSQQNYYTYYGGEVIGINDENELEWVMFADKQSGLSWEDAKWGIYYGQKSGWSGHYDKYGNNTKKLINIIELEDLGSYNEEEDALYKVFLETRKKLKNGGGIDKRYDELDEMNKNIVDERGYKIGDIIFYKTGEGSNIFPYKTLNGGKIVSFIEKGKHKELYVKTDLGYTVDYETIVK